MASSPLLHHEDFSDKNSVFDGDLEEKDPAVRHSAERNEVFAFGKHDGLGLSDRSTGDIVNFELTTRWL